MINRNDIVANNMLIETRKLDIVLRRLCVAHQGFKHDVSCIVRSEARRGHEDQSVHEARSTECTDVYPSGPWVPPISQCTIHHA